MLINKRQTYNGTEASAASVDDSNSSSSTTKIQKQSTTNSVSASGNDSGDISSGNGSMASTSSVSSSSVSADAPQATSSSIFSEPATNPPATTSTITTTDHQIATTTTVADHDTTINTNTANAPQETTTFVPSDTLPTAIVATISSTLSGSLVPSSSSTLSFGDNNNIQPTCNVACTSSSIITNGNNVSSPSSPNLSTGAIAGIAVGGVMTIIFLGACCVFCLKRRKRSNHNPSERLSQFVYVDEKYRHQESGRIDAEDDIYHKDLKYGRPVPDNSTNKPRLQEVNNDPNIFPEHHLYGLKGEEAEETTSTIINSVAFDHNSEKAQHLHMVTSNLTPPKERSSMVMDRDNYTSSAMQLFNPNSSYNSRVASYYHHDTPVLRNNSKVRDYYRPSLAMNKKSLWDDHLSATSTVEGDAWSHEDRQSMFFA